MLSLSAVEEAGSISLTSDCCLCNLPVVPLLVPPAHPLTRNKYISPIDQPLLLSLQPSTSFILASLSALHDRSASSTRQAYESTLGGLDMEASQ
jgi:hypothetical protein